MPLELRYFLIVCDVDCRCRQWNSENLNIACTLVVFVHQLYLLLMPSKYMLQILHAFLLR
jgi:hypothetical protein